MIKIENNVSMPQKKGGGMKAKYPWDKMKVGDSFAVKDVTQSALSSAASQWAHRNEKKWKFSVRAESGGFRIWRVA